MRLARLAIIAVAFAALAAGCATTEGRYSPLGNARYAPRDANAPVELFRSAAPTRPFDRIARLDVHIERTAWIPSGIDDAMPELLRQARRAGADAIIEFDERRSQIIETKVYHITATAIRYRD
jgi:hypothetical protein